MPLSLLILEVLFDPCRTWCPASTCQAVCQLQDLGLQTPQLVQCKSCDMEFCSACKARWHPGQGCPETMPVTFLPGETRYPEAGLGEEEGWEQVCFLPGSVLGSRQLQSYQPPHTLRLSRAESNLKLFVVLFPLVL